MKKKGLLLLAIITITIFLIGQVKTNWIKSSDSGTELALINGNGVRLRPSPDTEELFDPEIKMSEGDSVYIIEEGIGNLTATVRGEKVTSSWCKVKYQDIVGYVFEPYVTLTAYTLATLKEPLEQEKNERELIIKNALVGKTASLYYIGNLNPEVCAIQSACDCCSSDVIFYDDSNYIMIDRCVEQSDYIRAGIYKILDDNAVQLYGHNLSFSGEDKYDANQSVSGYEVTFEDYKGFDMLSLSIRECSNSGKYFLVNPDLVGKISKYNLNDEDLEIIKIIGTYADKISESRSPNSRKNTNSAFVSLTRNSGGDLITTKRSKENFDYMLKNSFIFGRFHPNSYSTLVNIIGLDNDPDSYKTLHTYVGIDEYREPSSWFTNLETTPRKDYLTVVNSNDIYLVDTYDRFVWAESCYILIDEGDIYKSDGINEFSIIVCSPAYSADKVSTVHTYTFDSDRDDFRLLHKFDTDVNDESSFDALVKANVRDVNSLVFNELGGPKVISF